ncbi:hypothetical protein SERLA73DRAFT_191675 [Serpula lacrymans var. lacrymans S7.3]|uniref:Uncharacterized protein n=1 Tax=Serpula lacrymans var. lacrymans (strain S7.3) TaxID=936435 RepID=F8QI24_SERL3|nr:hypothetical protein SERLA73DRAFT_191675 [Serpula lacrymans var. lacrymans S7.3]
MMSRKTGRQKSLPKTTGNQGYTRTTDDAKRYRYAGAGHYSCHLPESCPALYNLQGSCPMKNGVRN